MNNPVARVYDRHIMPRLVDLACSYHTVLRQRQRIVGQAEGVVVEFAIGAGHNLGLYDPARVRRVVGIDSNPGFLALGRDRFERSAIAVELVTASAEDPVLPRRIADTVVVTYALCSIGDVAAALGQARRVLKPAGRLVFVEHGRAPDAFTARWQRRLTPLSRRLAGGCRLDRDPARLIGDAGFAFDVLNAEWIAAFPRLASFQYSGVARPA